jgi:hypothetical protein
VTPVDYINTLCSLTLENVFNPYVHRCPVHDQYDAPNLRRDALLKVLGAAAKNDIDAIWIGRDLGYRGGRRTGLALTDDIHFAAHALRWGVSLERPTVGLFVAERTAAVIWSILAAIREPIFLWNVFPYHPHEQDSPFTNRSHNGRERRLGEELLHELVLLLRPKRIVAIGNDAAHSASRLGDACEVRVVRHPSYGGTKTFLRQMKDLYGLTSLEAEARLL